MLTEAQARLDEHFRSLASERAALNYPVYALEHGFQPAEIDALRSVLAQELKEGRNLSSAYWLPWVIVATEIGYAYDGDEYWDSFAKAIPNWRVYGVRSRIRSWFAEFARRYRGFAPTGRWAEHFSIIAWPIAHAILPRDLQGQFARHLYDLRYELANLPEYSVPRLGRLLRTNDRSGSSRFRNFLDQSELTARLMLALRDEDVHNVVPIIYRPTLARLVADLEGRQSARDWLREARTILREARFRERLTAAPRLGSTPETCNRGPESVGSVKLIARQSSEGGWLLGVQLPDLGQLIRQAGITTKTLDQTRVRRTDDVGHWMPGRALVTLASSEQRIQSITNLSGAPVLTLERNIQGLSALVAEALHVKGKPPWLLRLHDDGVARQVLGNHVRTGQVYLIVADPPLAPDGVSTLNLKLVTCGVSDASAYLLAVPRVLSARQLHALIAMKLGYALRATVEPIGLLPRWDSGSGCAVWLTTEAPLLRLSADHPVEEFSVSVDQLPAVRIPMSAKPEVLLALDDLEVGSHVVEVGGTTLGARGGRLDPERFDFIIRPPVPWAQGVRDRAGFRVGLEPAEASLERLLAGKARLILVGPPGRAVALGVRFFDLNGHMTEHASLGTIASSADAGGVTRLLTKLTKEPLAEKVQMAPRVDLTFMIDELGINSLFFPQKVRPFRWRLIRESHVCRVRLIDEAGADHPVAVHFYPLAQPDQKREAVYEDYIRGQVVEPPGALFSAICNNKRYSAVMSVPSIEILTALEGLGVRVEISSWNDTPKHITRLLALLRLWSHAQQTLGPLSLLRKAEVCQAFEQRIATILCGASWARLAALCLTADPPLERLRREIGGSAGFGARLRSTQWHHVTRDPSMDAEFARLASVYQVSDDPALCQLALRLAFAPTAIELRSPEEGGALFLRLSQVPILARGAFFARLVADRGEQAASDAGVA